MLQQLNVLGLIAARVVEEGGMHWKNAEEKERERQVTQLATIMIDFFEPLTLPEASSGALIQSHLAIGNYVVADSGSL